MKLDTVVVEKFVHHDVSCVLYIEDRSVYPDVSCV